MSTYVSTEVKCEECGLKQPVSSALNICAKFTTEGPGPAIAWLAELLDELREQVYENADEIKKLKEATR